MTDRKTTRTFQVLDTPSHAHYPPVSPVPIIGGEPAPVPFYIPGHGETAPYACSITGARPSATAMSKFPDVGMRQISIPLEGNYDPETKTVTLKEGFELEVTDEDWTPPPSRFDDVPENTKADKAEVAALRKALAACKGMTKEGFIAAVTPLKTETMSVTVSFNTTEDPESAAEQAAEKARANLAPAAGLLEAFKGCDHAMRTRTLRHLAHLYDIKKGQTWLR